VNSTQQVDLQKLVSTQAGEIETLKRGKGDLETSLNNLQGEHDKVAHENKILKRAVTIQQERQNQALSELTAARQFRVDAEERIRKLEQLVLSLRYHLQAQQMNTPGNDFMGFPPPDVY
jgi:DNA repair exonuclease SbcCD ATPase subunit